MDSEYDDLHSESLEDAASLESLLRGGPAPEAPSRAFAFTRADLLKVKPPDWLIEGIGEKNTLIGLFGETGGGKTFCASSMANAIVTGTPWFGHAVAQGSVFVIAGEGHNGIARRLAGWQAHTGISLREKPLYISNRSAAFLNEESAEKVTDAIAEIADQAGVKPVLIVVDTLARNYGGDENSTQDMQKFVDAMDALRHAWSATVMIVHHTGLTEKTRSRGSGALKCALDHEFQIVKHETGGIDLICHKMKEGPNAKTKHFDLVSVQAGDIQSAVLVEADAEAPRSIIKGPKLSPQKRRALDVLRDCIIDKGQKRHVRKNMPQVDCCTLEEFRSAAMLANLSAADQPDDQRRAINRVIEQLNSLNITNSYGDYIWIPD
jgi:KaiC/GvpD/RAD55 family RecA-like ATPase